MIKSTGTENTVKTIALLSFLVAAFLFSMTAMLLSRQSLTNSIATVLGGK